MWLFDMKILLSIEGVNIYDAKLRSAESYGCQQSIKRVIHSGESNQQ